MLAKHHHTGTDTLVRQRGPANRVTHCRKAQRHGSGVALRTRHILNAKGAKAEFDVKLACDLIIPAMHAYSTPTKITYLASPASAPRAGMNGGATNLPKLDSNSNSRFTAGAFVEHKETSTEAWVFYNQENKEVVLSFRGTSPKWGDFKDVKTDFNFRGTTPSAYLRDQYQALEDEGIKKEALQDKELVHLGFLESYAAVGGGPFPVLRRVIDTVIDGDDPSQWTLYVTGHSLGGALAMMAAYDIASSSPPYGIKVYTYGAPRVGNEAFHRKFHALVPDAWRIVNEKDFVPLVPPLKLGFSDGDPRHVRYVSDKGVYWYDENNVKHVIQDWDAKPVVQSPDKITEVANAFTEVSLLMQKALLGMQLLALRLVLAVRLGRLGAAVGEVEDSFLRVAIKNNPGIYKSALFDKEVYGALLTQHMAYKDYLDAVAGRSV